MKFKCIPAILLAFPMGLSQACNDDLQVLVEYMCQYQLISDTQCYVWLEDLRQGSLNEEIIWKSITNEKPAASQFAAVE